jgi:hypothetical protein
MSTGNVPPEAEIAHAISESMNLLFLFAAPRVYATYLWSSPTKLTRESTDGCLLRFIQTAAGIKERSPEVKGDVEQVVKAALLVEQVRKSLPTSRFDDALPEAVVEASRRALAALGFPPPAGGWDEFEGFPVPFPLPLKPQGRGA